MPPGAAEAVGGPLGFAISKWFLVVQGGAVVVAIVLAWVVWKLWAENRDLQETVRKMLTDRIVEARQDAATEREATERIVEEITRNRQVDEAVTGALKAVERRLESLERTRTGA